MLHTVVALVEDRPGVLNRVVSLFRRRGFNIESLAVGTTHEDGISRMTIIVDGHEGIVDQVEKQLMKLIDVIKVEDLTNVEAVNRELALIKVRCTAANRREVLEIAEIFRAQPVDLSPTSVTLQAVAQRDRVDGLLENLRPYGVMELMRTGRVSMRRGPQVTAYEDGNGESPEMHRFHQEAGRLPEGELPYVSD
jgi:acetolactate synthase-1/3 small subunit